VSMARARHQRASESAIQRRRLNGSGMAGGNGFVGVCELLEKFLHFPKLLALLCSSTSQMKCESLGV